MVPEHPKHEYVPATRHIGARIVSCIDSSTSPASFSLQLLGLISDKNTRKKTSSLAVHAVKRTVTLIKNGADVPHSPEFLQGLERFETCGSYLLYFRHGHNLLPSALDMIRRHVESIPEQGTKPRKLSFSALAFLRESARLQAELDRNYKSLVCGLVFWFDNNSVFDAAPDLNDTNHTLLRFAD
jgi:hypothetical protein